MKVNASTVLVSAVIAAAVSSALPATTPAPADVAGNDLNGRRQALERAGDPASRLTLAFVQDATGDTAAAEATLLDAGNAAESSEVSAEALLRLALLQFDRGDTDAARQTLERAARAGTPSASAAAVIAGLYAQPAVAARIAGATPDAKAELFRGNMALEAGDAPAAIGAFERARTHVTTAADRRYANERIIAAARQAGSVTALIDAWSKDQNLPADRVLPLVLLMRDSGRIDDLLAWHRRATTATPPIEAAASVPVLREIISAAVAADRGEAAAAICRSALEKNPDDPSWLAATATVLIDQGKAADADQLLSGSIRAESTDAADILRVGRLSASLGRYDVALSAAGRVAERGGTDAIAADLLRASIHTEVGATSAAAAALRSASEAVLAAAADPTEMATALEAANLPAEAIRLLRLTLERGGPNEALAGHLATLLMQQKRPTEAMPLFEMLRDSAATESVRAQAGQRLLDAAVAARAVDQLIARLMADGGPAKVADLDLVVDAYRRTKRGDAAIALLQKSKVLTAAQRCARLATLYVREKKLDDADRALRELLELDPSQKTLTLQQIASVAIDRRRPQEAQAAMQTLESLLPPGPASDETLAGLQSQLGNANAAAALYARALQVRPNNADDWLLWATAMGKAGQSSAAVQRLLLLLNETSNSAVFAAAVDGLVDLHAPPGVLRVARREAMYRFARSPSQVLLGQVVRDLCDELQDAERADRAVGVALAFGAEQRPQLLREQMEALNAQGDVGAAVACGRTLLLIGDEFPPQLFIDLGEQLLLAGKPAEASGAFSRAAASGGDVDFVPRAAELFLRFGYADAATKTLRPLAFRRPADADVKNLVARAEEIVGRSEEAFDLYCAALDLQLRRLEVDQASAGDALAAGLVASRLPYAVALGGALATASTPQQQDRLLDVFTSNLNRAMAAGGGDRLPRFVASVMHGLRRAGYALGRPEVVDAADDAVLARWPDNVFKIEALTARWDATQYGRLQPFAERYGLQGYVPLALRGLPPETQAIATQPTATEAAPTQPAAMSPAQALAVLPQLALDGDSTAVRSAIDAALASTPADPAVTFPFIVSAAGTRLGRAAVSQSVFRWIDAVAAMPLKPAAATRPALKLDQPNARFYRTPLPPAQLRTAATAAWRTVDRADRPAVIAKLLDYARSRTDFGPDSAYRLALKLAAAAGVDVPDDVRLAASLIEGSTDVTEDAIDLFPLVAPGRRADYFRKALAAVPPDQQLMVLLRTAARFGSTLDSDLERILVDKADAITSGAIEWNDWFAKPMSPRLLAAMAGMVRRADGSESADAAALTMAAAAFARSGDATAADATAAAAFLKPEAAEPPGRLDTNPVVVAAKALRRIELLRIAAAVMSPPARLTSLAAVGTDTAWDSVRRATLLDAVGRTGESLTLLRQAIARWPGDELLQYMLVDRLKRDGRDAEIVRLFRSRAATSPAAVRKAIAQSLVNLFRSSEGQRVAPAEGSKAFPMPDFSTPAASGDRMKSVEALRRVAERLRSGEVVGLLSPVVPVEGGFRDSEHDSRVPVGLSNSPQAVATLLTMLRTMPASTYLFDAPMYWANSLFVNIASVADRDAAVDMLDAKARAGTLVRGERQLMQAIALRGGLTLPPSFVAELRAATRVEESTNAVRAWANAVEDTDPHAARVARDWEKWRLKTGGTATQDLSQFPLPSEPTPMDPVGPAGVKWLQAVLDAGDIAAFDDSIRVMERVSGALPFEAEAVVARAAAERGDLSEFARRLDRWMTTSTLRAGATPDVNMLLPQKPVNDAVREGVVRLTVTRLTAAQQASPARADWAIAACQVCRWLETRHADAAAVELFHLADRWGEEAGVGVHQLFVADIAKQIGETKKSDAIELRLLEAGCLPAGRVVAVLKRLNDEGRGREAESLARQTASSCRDPRLLTWLASQGERAGATSRPATRGSEK